MVKKKRKVTRKQSIVKTPELIYRRPRIEQPSSVEKLGGYCLTIIVLLFYALICILLLPVFLLTIFVILILFLLDKTDNTLFNICLGILLFASAPFLFMLFIDEYEKYGYDEYGYN